MKERNKALRIYKLGGQYAVYEAVEKGLLNADSWRDCIPCDDRTPHTGDECLVCGGLHQLGENQNVING